MARVLRTICKAVVLFATLVPCAAFAGSATICWQGCTEPDLEGYRVYYGNSPGIYGPYIPVGNVTCFTLDGLTDGQTYYFVVTSVDKVGNESAYSSPPVSKAIPAQVTTSEPVSEPPGKKDRTPGRGKK